MVKQYSKYGSDLVVDLLQRYGIEYVSLNPGSSFRGLHDSLVNYGGNRPEIIECPHEEVAVAMAHGYAKATGKPMAAIVHNVVGLLHATMAIYYAYLDRVPVIVIGATGPMDTARRRPHIDWIHTAVVQGNAVRDYVKWDDQPFSAEAVPDSFARAYRVAMTEPRGPVYLCYDVSFQEDPLPGGIALPDPARTAPPTPLQAEQGALGRLADWLVQADLPIILTEYIARVPGSVAALVELAELVGAGVVDLNGRLNFPTRHALNVTHGDLLPEADLVLALDVSDLYGELTRLDRVSRRTEYLTRQGCRLAEIGFGDLQIGGWSQAFQKLQEVDLSILADTAVALPEVVRLCRQRLDGAGERRAAERRRRVEAAHHAAMRAWEIDAHADWDAQPMTPARLASEVWEGIKGEDWVLTAGTLNDWALRLWDMEGPHRHAGRSLGTATQIGISLGVALAHRGSGKLVVDLQPDGDLLFDASALWVAAHHQIPMLAVMYNNRAYYNDWDHQIRIAKARGTDEAKAYLGMEIDNPPPDFAGLARSFGWYAEGPITDPREVGPALQRAIHVIKTEGRPALLDTVTRFR